MKQTGKRRWGRALVAALTCAAAMTMEAQQPDPRARFERARLLEENPRQLAQAVEAYRAVLAEAGDDRALAGAAHLQIGLALERLGDDAARDVFARIVRDFADQPTLVSAARMRLAVADAQVTDLTPRRVALDPAFPNAVSPDGLRVASTGNDGLAIKELPNGAWTRIVPGVPGAGPQFPLFSPDASFMSFRWLTDSTVPTAGVSVMEAKPGATPRAVLAPYARGKNPIAWSPDGRELLLYSPTSGANPAAQLGATGAELDWVDVASGAVRPIRRFEPWRRAGQSGVPGVRGVSLSPDGTTIAFSARTREGSTEEHIVIMDANGSNERAAVQIAGTNRQPRWTPDGSHLLFVNDRSGQRALMAVPIQGGAAAGEPRVVQSNFVGDLVDLTRTGDLYYMSQASGGFSMFVAERGTPTPRIVQTFKGQSGAWSRGGRLAFVRPGPAGQDLIVRSMATGEERLYQHSGITVVSPRWFSDDSAVIVHINPANSVRLGGAFYRVDLVSGTFTHLLDLNRDGRLRASVTALSPDDRTLYTVMRDEPEGPWKALIGIDLATGAEQTIVTFAGAGLPGRSTPGIAVSPDGQTIAIQAWTDDLRDGRIFTVRADGTSYREVYARVRGGGWGDAMRWTPDGQFLVFAEKEGTGPTAPWRSMIIPVTGGAGVLDGLDSSKFSASVPLPLIEIGNVASIDLSPDGSQIVFGSRTIPTYDLWVLENVPAHLGR